jgi:hypothetical protein
MVVEKKKAFSRSLLLCTCTYQDILKSIQRLLHNYTTSFYQVTCQFLLDGFTTVSQATILDGEQQGRPAVRVEQWAGPVPSKAISVRRRSLVGLDVAVAHVQAQCQAQTKRLQQGPPRIGTSFLSRFVHEVVPCISSNDAVSRIDIEKAPASLTHISATTSSAASPTTVIVVSMILVKNC